MADVSLADIKALRERLGTGMVDTKNALVEAGGDFEKAVEILRLKGAKGNAKRADRSTSEGLIAAVESATATTMIELACETDFVAKSDKFVALGNVVLEALADSGAETLEAALAILSGGKSLAAVIDDEHEALRRGCIKTGGRLIEQDKLRLVKEGTCEGKTLKLTA